MFQVILCYKNICVRNHERGHIKISFNFMHLFYSLKKLASALVINNLQVLYKREVPNVQHYCKHQYTCKMQLKSDSYIFSLPNSFPIIQASINVVYSQSYFWQVMSLKLTVTVQVRNAKNS